MKRHSKRRSLSKHEGKFFGKNKQKLMQLVLFIKIQRKIDNKEVIYYKFNCCDADSCWGHRRSQINLFLFNWTSMSNSNLFVQIAYDNGHYLSRNKN